MRQVAVRHQPRCRVISPHALLGLPEGLGFRDFKDTVHPFFESATFSSNVFCCVESFSDSSNRGMSKQYPLTVFLESPKGVHFASGSAHLLVSCHAVMQRHMRLGLYHVTRRQTTSRSTLQCDCMIPLETPKKTSVLPAWGLPMMSATPLCLT